MTTINAVHNKQLGFKAKRAKALNKNNLQAGFSLIEISIVTAIVLLLAIIAIPSVNAYVVENKVPKVGEELARFILQTQINSQPGSGVPYADINTLSLANAVEGSTVLAVKKNGGNTEVLHGLGTDGKVTINTSDGSNFTLSLDNVSQAACPSLASVMQRVVNEIKLGESGSEIAIKSSSVEYNALTAKSNCSKGDVNSFVFTIS